MEFKLLGDKAEVEALNKYPTGCIKHLGLVKYVKGVCKRQRATTLSEVVRWLERYKDSDDIDHKDMLASLKAVIVGNGIDVS
jgi:hypothetical protein